MASTEANTQGTMSPHPPRSGVRLVWLRTPLGRARRYSASRIARDSTAPTNRDWKKTSVLAPDAQVRYKHTSICYSRSTLGGDLIETKLSGMLRIQNELRCAACRLRWHRCHPSC